MTAATHLITGGEEEEGGVEAGAGATTMEATSTGDKNAHLLLLLL